MPLIFLTSTQRLLNSILFSPFNRSAEKGHTRKRTSSLPAHAASPTPSNFRIQRLDFDPLDQPRLSLLCLPSKTDLDDRKKPIAKDSEKDMNANTNTNTNANMNMNMKIPQSGSSLGSGWPYIGDEKVPPRSVCRKVGSGKQNLQTEFWCTEQHFKEN